MTDDTRRISYTAASALPLKVLQNPTVRAGLTLGKILPVHMQVIPTDRCNLNCAWCSCANDSRQITMSLEDMAEVVEVAKRWNTRAVTITGGGEPMMHPQISEIIHLWADAGIEIGLVSNGYLFPKKADPDALRRLKWCRISVSDDRVGLHEFGSLALAVGGAADAAPDVNWAFSYVVTKDFDADKLAFTVRLATERRFTHVRAVSNLLDLEHTPSMERVRQALRALDVDDRLVIYQGRKEYTKGAARCLISLLKPVIGADGRVFPCCGAQYALEEVTRNMSDELCMGDIGDLDAIFSEQRNFCGSVCHRCYYSMYNELLNGLTAPIEHGEFV